MMKNKGITVDIAVDAGREYVKVVRYDGVTGRIKKLQFISYISDDENTTLDDQIRLEEGDYRLTVDGKKMFIGAVAGGAGENGRGITHDEKYNEDTLSLIYAGIYAGGATSSVVVNQIRLAVCVPMENVSKEKENFKKLVGTRHSVIDNGVEHEFEIVAVEVFGEGLISAFAIPLNLMKQLDDHLVGYLNIGSFKSNIGTFFYRGLRAEYQDRYSGSLNGIGMQEARKNGTEGSLVKATMTRLNGRFHWNEKFVDVKDARREKPSKIVLCGGAASDLEEDFAKAFQADGRNNKADVIVHPEGIFSDAVGSLNLARMRWQAK
jgi:Actin like proteins N terminal domain